MKAHQVELKKLHHKLDAHADTSLDHFRQAAMVRTSPPGSQQHGCISSESCLGDARR